jgi:hypothetical protein
MLLFSGRTILFPSALPTTLLWGSDRRPGLSIKQFGERQPKNQLAGDILDLNGVVPRILPLSDELIPEILGPRGLRRRGRSPRPGSRDQARRGSDCGDRTGRERRSEAWPLSLIAGWRRSSKRQDNAARLFYS